MDQVPSFTGRVVDLRCAQVDHKNQPIEGLCINLDCQIPQRAICFSCSKLHRDHSKDLIEIPQIEEFLKNTRSQIPERIAQVQVFKSKIIEQLDEIQKIVEQESAIKQLVEIDQMTVLNMKTLEELGVLLGQTACLRGQKVEFLPFNMKEEMELRIKEIHHQLDLIGELLSIKLIEWIPRFNNALKPKDIRVEGKNREIAMCTKGFLLDSPLQWCVSDQVFPMSQISRWIFRIVNQKYDFRIGIYSLSLIQERKFMGWDEAFRGMYVIRSDGLTFQQSQGGLLSNFRFETKDLIDCEFNPKTKSFTLINLTKNLRHSYNIDGTEIDLVICVGLWNEGDSIELMLSSLTQLHPFIHKSKSLPKNHCKCSIQ